MRFTGDGVARRFDLQFVRAGTELVLGSIPVVMTGMEGGCPLCSGATQTSFVAQLRKTPPLDIGICYWVCLASPSSSFYLPFHFGIEDFPPAFRSDSPRPSQKLFHQMVNSPFEPDSPGAFWTFSSFHHKMASASPQTTKLLRQRIVEIEESFLAAQGSIEDTARKSYSKDRPAATKLLTGYSEGACRKALAAMREFLRDD